MSDPLVPIAQGQNVRISFEVEDVMGVTNGSPAMTLLRTTKRNINLKKAILRSEEINTNGQVNFLRHGMKSVDGAFEAELATQSYDGIFEPLFGDDWEAITVAGSPNLQATASTKRYTRAAGSFVTDGFRAGDIIIAAGFTSGTNNGLKTVTAVASSTLTVAETLVDEASTSGRTIALKGKRLDAGTRIDTLTIERAFTDIEQYQVFNGVTLNSAEINIQPENIVKLTLGLLGMSAAAMATSELDDPDTTGMDTQPIAAFEGAIYEGGAIIGIVTALTISMARNRNLTGVVGSQVSPQVFTGTLVTTGTLSAFFFDETLYNKFVDETESSVFCKLADPDGNFLNIVLGTIKYTGDEMDPPAQGGVVQNMPFEALATNGPGITIQRSNT